MGLGLALRSRAASLALLRNVLHDEAGRALVHVLEDKGNLIGRVRPRAFFVPPPGQYSRGQKSGDR